MMNYEYVQLCWLSDELLPRIWEVIGHCSTSTTHLFSIERADWPKLHDMFKARDAIAWQREFPVGFPVEVSALNSLFINIFHDAVARIESRYVIKATRLVGLLIRSILRWKNRTN